MIPTIFYAQHKIRMWQIYLKGFLFDLQEVKLNHLQEQQEIATFLNDFVRTTSDSIKEDEMKNLHKEFFTKAKDVINLKNEGDLPKAKQTYQELVQVSEKIVSLLDGIAGQAYELSPNIQDV